MTTSPPIWRLLPFSERQADEELAASEGLLAGLALVAQPAVRWYGASRLALVIGSGQRPTDVAGAALAAAGATLHRRASGGTSVLFVPGLLMQDLALPLSHSLYHIDVSESYAWLGQLWVETLGRLGIRAELVEVAAARADAQTLDPRVRRACFGGRSPYEVLAGGRKLVGFSQIRRRAGALFQVGLYTHWPGAALTDLLCLSPDERIATVAALADRVVGLDELLPNPPSFAQVQAAFGEALTHRHGVALYATHWRPDELAAHQAALSRYAPLLVG